MRPETVNQSETGQSKDKLPIKVTIECPTAECESKYQLPIKVRIVNQGRDSKPKWFLPGESKMIMKIKIANQD
jgi:hypothetical protein